jgi:hypothetical protein
MVSSNSTAVGMPMFAISSKRPRARRRPLLIW